MKIIEELKILFGSKFNFYFYLIFFLSIIANIFEVISIGSIGLLIGFIVEPNFLEEYSQIALVNNFYELDYKKNIRRLSCNFYNLYNQMFICFFGLCRSKFF